MSWLESSGRAGMALRCATYDGRRWLPPSTIAAGDSFFVNWADAPGIRSLGGQRLAAQWLWRGAGPNAIDVRVSQSDDDGRSWSRPVTPHRDGTATEHGFVSLVPHGAGVLAVWLDGRKQLGHPEGSPGPMPDMALRAASLDRDGRLGEELEIDGRACDCCQTAAVATSRGIVVAYRDRSPAEVRDIYVARNESGHWSEPQRVHADGWQIAGCPVNGPALDARGSRVVITWYTAAADSPRILVAFSEDAGAHFGLPTRIDDGHPVGRVGVTLLADGSALATWLEASGHDALIRARRISALGGVEAAITVAQTSSAHASGCPRVARRAGSVVFAWTEAGAAPQVRVARLSTR